jgi:mannose-6-phosphate isomerase-like protein (cupin superfamily)
MNKRPKITSGKVVSKGWGREIHIANNDDYCGKLLVFEKGKKFSMHYHVDKYETWYIQEGSFKFYWIDPETADTHIERLGKGDVVTIHQGIAHQLKALEDSIIFEVSTPDKVEDSYRVLKGDSQR